MNYTAEDILQKIRDLSPVSFSINFRFSFPYTYIEVVHKDFAEKDFQEQEELLATAIGIEVSELRSFQSQSMVVFDYKGESREVEKLGTSVTGHHWLSESLEIDKKSLPDSSIPSIHFYGFKGGQARSTVLGMLAKSLADDGWKVLVIDADIEASSLEIMFGIKTSELSKTLLGCYLGENLSSVPAYSSGNVKFNGSVEVILSRPDVSNLDIEYSAFLVKAANDPNVTRNLCTQLNAFAESKRFDILFIDHRSGLSSFPLFWYENFPGSVVFFARLDNQWTSGTNYLRMFSRLAKDKPKVIVTFKMHKNDSEIQQKRNLIQKESLLEILSDLSEEDNIDSINHSQWIEWGYDSAFESQNLPKLNSVTSKIIHSLENLRSELDLTDRKETTSSPIESSISGARDQGDFITTPLLREVFKNDSNINYIFGRKGTGKTRLYREFVNAGIGLPLLSSPDFKEDKGVGSRNSIVDRAVVKFKQSKKNFWLTLILAGLKSKDYATKSIEVEWEESFNSSSDEIYYQIIKELEKRKLVTTFLIDGVENAFSAEEITAYIDALFQVLSTIQYDSKYNKKLHFKLLLREDLINSGTENVEQQIEGRSLYLYWDTVSILNFLIFKISENSWFSEKFPKTIEKIRERENDIKFGSLISEVDVANLLKEIFPPKIKKHKVHIMSFFKNYFSDASGTRDNEAQLNYYPRVFIDFLKNISNSDKNPIRFYGEKIVENKINEELVYKSHIRATEDYFKQVKEELKYMVSFDRDPTKNLNKLDIFLKALSGEQTPFELSKLTQTVYHNISREGLEKKEIESALNSMKSLGIFEDWPKNPGHWRVGKLFKQALNMKFRRVKNE